MTQTTMFNKEIKQGRDLMKATKEMWLCVLELTYTKTTARSLISDHFKDRYFTIDRHNKMIAE